VRTLRHRAELGAELCGTGGQGSNAWYAEQGRMRGMWDKGQMRGRLHGPDTLHGPGGGQEKEVIRVSARRVSHPRLPSFLRRVCARGGVAVCALPHVWAACGPSSSLPSASLPAGPDTAHGPGRGQDDEIILMSGRRVPHPSLPSASLPARPSSCPLPGWEARRGTKEGCGLELQARRGTAGSKRARRGLEEGLQFGLELQAR
jgi:hypothetical protein